MHPRRTVILVLLGMVIPIALGGIQDELPTVLSTTENTQSVGPPGAGSGTLNIFNTTYFNGNHSYGTIHLGCSNGVCGSIVTTGDLVLTVNTLTIENGASIIAYDNPTNTQGVGGSIQLSASWKGTGAGGAGHDASGGSGGGAASSNGGASYGVDNETGSNGGSITDSNGNLVSDGGGGGGRILIYADTIEIYGSVLASGSDGDPGYRYNNGSGTGGPGAGGGSGGTIVMRANTITLGGSTGAVIRTDGGDGGNGANGDCLPGNPCLFMYDGGDGGGGGSGGNLDICASSSSNLLISSTTTLSASGGTGGTGGSPYGTGVAGTAGSNGGAGTTTSTCTFQGWSSGGSTATTHDWEWVSTGYSGSYTWSWDVVVDGSTSYVVGWFAGTATFGSTNLTSAGERDIFVAAADSNGSWLWATSAGGNEYDYGMGIDLAPDGTLRITGYAAGSATFGNLTMSGKGNRDIFVASLDQNGTWLWLWSGGGQNHEEAVDIGVDAAGNSVVVGYQYSSTATYGTSTVNNSDDADTVVLSIDANGTWQWTEVIVADFVRPHSVDVAPNGTSILVGEHGQPVTANGQTYPLSGNKGRDDAFIGALDKNGTWIFFKALGGEETDHLTAVALDGKGGAFVAGTIGCHSGTPCTSNLGGINISAPTAGASLLGHISLNGTWTWINQMNNSVTSGGSSTPNDLAVGPSGHGYMTGEIFGTVLFGSLNATSNGTNAHDPFIAAFTPSGGWQWTLVGGSTASDQGHGIDVGASEQISVVGYAAPGGHFGKHRVNGTGSTVAFLALSVTPDADGDGVLIPVDRCPHGDSGWSSNNQTDFDGDGCRDLTEDTDDDDDGVEDVYDQCPFTPLGSTVGMTGCRDTDADGIDDALDACPTSTSGIISNGTTDHDSDGCIDAVEDDNDDNDSIDDAFDLCPKGAIGWVSNTSNDHDNDGCIDTSEDLDDDNDMVEDINDHCPIGAIGWMSSVATDHDQDGCQDDGEDLDDDNDTVSDTDDLCPRSPIGWTPSPTSDHDGDGCNDHGEDDDDDGDGVLDTSDSCPTGSVDWTSDITNDLDGDGCRDDTEDMDDDEDGLQDDEDRCPAEITEDSDHDQDGCSNTSDDDDDDDGIHDDHDDCPTGAMNWTSTDALDHDQDGCQDSTEDLDDDDDGINDEQDSCPVGRVSWTPDSINDLDADGCDDSSEDLDDDDDGISDIIDACPLDPDINCPTTEVVTENGTNETLNQTNTTTMNETIEEDLVSNQTNEENNTEVVQQNESTGITEDNQTNTTQILASSATGSPTGIGITTVVAVSGIFALLGMAAGIALGKDRSESDGILGTETGSGMVKDFSMEPLNLESSQSGSSLQQQQSIEVTHEWQDETGYTWRRLSDGRDEWWDGQEWTRWG